MQKNTLHWKRVTLIALLSFLFITGWATNEEDERAIIIDFWSICETGQNLPYTITDATNHYVTLTHPSTSPNLPWGGSTAPTGPIVIPETVTNNGITYTVTAIESNTFKNCQGLTGNLVIPNTIKTIGKNAFDNCVGFHGTLTIGNSVEEIGVSAFSYCENLSGSLVLPNSLIRIGKQTFQGCESLTGTLTLPNSLVDIGQSAFLGCGFTGALNLPNTINSIGASAFKDCSGFTGDLILPQDLTVINYASFESCSGFNGILVIPANVATIYGSAFDGCNHIQAMYVCADTPPVATYFQNYPPFYGMISSIPVYVPYCSVNTYSSTSGWNYFSNFQGRSFFVADGDWSNAANWTCQTLPTSGQSAVIAANCTMDATSASIASLIILKNDVISIQPDAKLNVNNTITNYGNASNLIIEDGGQLMHNQNGVLATVKKNINAYNSSLNDGWNLISSPLSSNVAIASVGNMLAPEYDLYYYDEPTYYWINQKDDSNNFTELTPNKGYLYANSNNIELEFAGTLKKGTLAVTISPLSYQGAYLQGFNLIGNPFAHNVTSFTAVDIAEQGFYKMNGAATDLMLSEISEDEPLKPAEGIFVLATSENASITLNPDNTRSNSTKTGSICLEILENGKISDRMLVKRNEGSDFHKLSIRENRTKLFATKDKEELAIVVCNNNEQTVNFKTAHDGTYTLSMTLKGVEADYLHLIDNLTGNNIDLLATPTYTFQAKATDYASRFRLVFSPEAIENADSDSFAFIANGEFIIANEGVATLQVTDLTGRILSSETINGSFNMPINLSSGVYMLRLINENNVRTQKIVVE